jgi:hypothetical protein
MMARSEPRFERFGYGMDDQREFERDREREADLKTQDQSCISVAAGHELQGSCSRLR